MVGGAGLCARDLLDKDMRCLIYALNTFRCRDACGVYVSECVCVCVCMYNV